jgi:uncharacterized membrane protein
MTFIISIILFIFIFIKFANLSDKVTNLEKKIEYLNKPNNILNPNFTPSANVKTDQSPINLNVNSPGNFTPIAPAENQIINWFKENWLLKLGVFLILVGFGWFISYAFVHNWIGPIGRVSLGLITGSIMALFGTFRMDKNTIQGKLFLILGSALTIITIYAGNIVYGYFSPLLLLSLVFLVSVYVAVVALQFQMKNIAIYGLVISYISPFFVDSVIETKLIFTYLVVVSLASIWLATIKYWRDINAVSIVGFMLHALPYLFASYKVNSVDEFFVLMSIFGLGFIYFFVSVYGAIKNQESANQSDVIVAIFDSVIIILATLAFLDKEVISLVLAGWMIVFALGSFVVFSYTKKEKFFYVYSLIAILLLAIATAAELDGSALVYAYAIESAIVSVAGYIVTRKLNVGYILSILMIGPALMSIPSIASRNWRTGIFHDDFGVLFTVGSLLLGLGFFYYYSEQEKEFYKDEVKIKFYPALVIAGSFFFLILVWLSSGAFFIEKGSAVLFSLVTYTILGISTYFYGLTQENKIFKYYGGTLLIFVVLRLVLIDVWDMELGARIVTFILIGALFISTAFLGNKNKKVLTDNLPNNHA